MFSSRKNILLIVGLCMFCGTASAGWWKTFGESGWDEARCIQITSDGNYIISGAKNNTLWLIKTDTSGVFIWGHTYGPSDGTRSRWLEETNDEGYIVAPRTPSLLKVNTQGDSVWAYDYGMYSYCVQETSDNGYIVVGGENGYGYDAQLILIKTDAQGKILWSRIYTTGFPELCIGFFIQQTIDGGYVITGRHGTESEEYSSQALWLVKTDSLGDTLWTKEYGEWNSGERNTGFCVRQTADTGYVIVGHRDFGDRGLWILKTNSLGDTLWTKTYTAPSGGEGYCIQEIDDGYIICGTTTYWLSTSLKTDGTDLWLIKTDKTGDTIWTRSYGGEDSDMGFCVQQTADSGYVVVGYTESYGSGKADIYMLKTDSLGLLGLAEKPIPESTKKWNTATSIGGAIVLRYSDCPGGLRVTTFDACGRNIDAVFVPDPSGTLTLGEDYPTGVYFIQIRNNNQTRTARVVLIH